MQGSFESFVVTIVVAWVAIGLGLGWVMGRRGFEAYTWTFLGIVFGPIAVVLAITMVIRNPDSEPVIVGLGRSRAGSVDVLVGTDGSPGSRAAEMAAEALLDGRIGRLTLAAVVPIDASGDVVQMAEARLEEDRLRVGPDASAVLLRGLPADALREYAKRLSYELIAIGTRGAGRSHAVLGSVASTLARGSVVPVLLVEVTTDKATTDAEPYEP